MAFVSILGETLKGEGKATIPTADALKDVDVVGLYFSAHWCPPCRGFTPRLAELYKQVKDASKSFEIVFVSSDRDEDAFNSYHGEHPWLALPFSDRERKAKLSSKFKVSGIPTLVLLDKQGNLITTKGRNIVQAGADAYPWKPKTFDEMLGDKFAVGDKFIDKAALTGGAGRVLGLYFSAHWCGPCRGFTPELIKRYNQLKEAGKNLEILFVSSDRDEKSFQEYFGDMPWAALPFENREAKSELSDHFDVEGIPTLVFYDCENKKVITDNGRSAIMADSFIEDFPFHPKPVNDLAFGADGINEHPSLVVLTEDCDEDVQSKVKEALNKVAAEEFAKPEDDRAVGRFFDATGGQIAPQIRKNCNLGAAAKTPSVLILNLGDQGAYHLPAEEGDVTDAYLRKIVDAFGNGSLERKQWGA